jgi:endonuclease/exonuclease/phosphatase family metal-dependent hydrolase
MKRLPHVVRLAALALALAGLAMLGGCSDKDRESASQIGTALLRDQFGFSALALNLYGTDTDFKVSPNTTVTIPWRARYDRIFTWLDGHAITPDIIALQDVIGFHGCPLERVAADNETVLHLLAGLRARRGANYRVANITVRQSPQGLCTLMGGKAIIYNADRLRNLTHRLARDPVQSGNTSEIGFHARQSHPCTNPIAAHRDLCQFIDGPTFVTAFKRADGSRYELGPTVSIFDLVKQPGPKLHVYNEHLNSDLPEAFEALKTTIAAGEARFPDNRLYPPILLGDFNIDIKDMTKEVANPAGIFGPFTMATYLKNDVVGILAGKTTAFPSSQPLKVLETRAMPVEQPSAGGFCSPIAELWSDHCGVFARFAPA